MGRAKSTRVSAPQCHADRHAASAVRGSGTRDVAKAEALIEATGGIVGPHAETKAKPAASGLADQRAHELLASALATRIRFHADRHFRRLFVSIGDPELFGTKAPCPGCTDDFAVLCGDEPEIARSLPANEIFGDARNSLRRLCIGFIGCYREKMPQDLKVILDSRTDHKIGHRTRLSFGFRLRCRRRLGEPAQLLLESLLVLVAFKLASGFPEAISLALAPCRRVVRPPGLRCLRLAHRAALLEQASAVQIALPSADQRGAAAAPPSR